jgi:hypothetical protein
MRFRLPTDSLGLGAGTFVFDTVSRILTWAIACETSLLGLVLVPSLPWASRGLRA